MRQDIFILSIWFVFLPTQQRVLDAAIKSQLITTFTARKISHLAVGFWAVPLAAFVHHWYLAAIPITMILAANIHANSQRGSLGRLTRRVYPLVAFLLPEMLILYFWRQQRSDVVVLAVLAMTVGDTAAAYVGIRFGRLRIPWTGKTVEGGIANFIGTLLVLAGVGHLYRMPLDLFVLPAVLVACLEAVLPGEWDNPLTVIVLLVLLAYPL